jgi:hypothetical protein
MDDVMPQGQIVAIFDHDKQVEVACGESALLLEWYLRPESISTTNRKSNIKLEVSTAPKSALHTT